MIQLRRIESNTNGGNDDYVSDETTQTVKDRDNAFHLILYRTFISFVHRFFRVSSDVRKNTYAQHANRRRRNDSDRQKESESERER